MATSRTRPTDASVAEFLDSAATARRRAEGHALDAIFREVTCAEPVMWGPSIVGYGAYLSISPSDPRRRATWPKTGFSPRRAAHSLYGLKAQPEAAELLPSLGEYTEGSGCVYVKRLDRIDLDVLRRLIAVAWTRSDDPEP